MPEISFCTDLSCRHVYVLCSPHAVAMRALRYATVGQGIHVSVMHVIMVQLSSGEIVMVLIVARCNLAFRCVFERESE